MRGLARGYDVECEKNFSDDEDQLGQTLHNARRYPFP